MSNKSLLYKLMSSNSKAYQQLLINKKFIELIKPLNQKSIVLDIGANIGNVSNFILEKKGSKVFAFEPNKLCFEILARRFIDDSRVKTFNLAVSNYSGLSKLYLHQKSKGITDFNYIESSSIKNEKDNVSEINSVEVNVEHISKILSKFSYIDLIKIDAEGSEYEIIPFLIDNKNKIKNVLCELHGNPQYNKNKEFYDDYQNLLTSLKKSNLYNNWFYEWH